MKTTSLCIQLKRGMNAQQTLDKKLESITPDERQRMLQFLESLAPDDQLDDPGSLLGFIHDKLAA